MSDTTIFSFAPDRKSLQRATFNGAPTTYSVEQTVRIRLNQIYQDKYAGVQNEFRQSLIDSIVPGVPMIHRNPEMAAAANYLIHVYLQNDPDATLDEMTPGEFGDLFASIEGILMPASKDYNAMLAKTKASLYRYMVYIWRHTKKNSQAGK